MGKDKHQPGEAEVKVATVELESVDNMATLPVGQHRQQGSDIAIAEKHNTVNKEMELKSVQPKPLKKYVKILFLYFLYTYLHNTLSSYMYIYSSPLKNRYQKL